MFPVTALIFTESVLKLNFDYRSCYNAFSLKFKLFILNFTDYTNFYSCYLKKAIQSGYLIIFSFDGLIKLTYAYTRFYFILYLMYLIVMQVTLIYR